MNIERQLLRCGCGSYAVPQSIWLTDEKSMMFVAYCVTCNILIKIFYPIATMFADCPLPKMTEAKLIECVDKEIANITGGPLRPPLKMAFTSEDQKFMKMAHIADEVEE
jgi:hypothetical protein